MSKLTKEQVRKIREIGHREPMRKLASKFRVSHVTIYKIIHRKSRASLKDKPCPTCGE